MAAVINENLGTVPISVLRLKTREKLSFGLNPIKCIPSEEGIQRDFRGLMVLAKVERGYFNSIEAHINPFEEIWKYLTKKSDPISVHDLLEILGKIDRWDVIDDYITMINNDVEHYLKMQRERGTVGEKTKMMEGNFINPMSSCNIITVQDVMNAEEGKPPQKFDAFVLYAEEDHEFAIELTDRMEKYGHTICTRDHFLGGTSTFEYDAILSLIIERCNLLIALISNAFLKSSEINFFMNCAQNYQIKNNKKKIIPCLIEEGCTLPVTLSFLYMLPYKSNMPRRFDFWKILSENIKSNSLSIDNKEVARKTDSGESATESSPEKSSTNVNMGKFQLTLPLKGSAVSGSTNSLKVPQTAESKGRLSPIWPPAPKMRSSFSSLSDISPMSAPETRSSNGSNVDKPLGKKSGSFSKFTNLLRRSPSKISNELDSPDGTESSKLDKKKKKKKLALFG